MAEDRLSRMGASSSARPAEGESGGSPSLARQLLQPRTLVSFLIAFLIIAFVFSRQHIPFVEVLQHMKHANVGLYLLAFATYYSSFYVRAVRWRRMLCNAGYGPEHGKELPRTRSLIRIVYLSWFANTVLPAKLGDGYRGYLLKRNAGVSFTKAVGTIVAERITDVAVLFSMLVLCGLLAFRDHLPAHFDTLVFFGALLAVLSISALFALKLIGPWIAQVLPERVRPHYLRLEEGVLRAYSGQLPLIVLLTIFVWLLESARFWLVAASLGVHFTPALAIFIALTASLLTTVPFTPAGLGIVEGAMIAALLFVIDDRSLAGSIALLDRTITYWSIVVIGAVVYLISRNR